MDQDPPSEHQRRISARENLIDFIAREIKPQLYATLFPRSRINPTAEEMKRLLEGWKVGGLLHLFPYRSERSSSRRLSRSERKRADWKFNNALRQHREHVLLDHGNDLLFFWFPEVGPSTGKNHVHIAIKVPSLKGTGIADFTEYSERFFETLRRTRRQGCNWDMEIKLVVPQKKGDDRTAARKRVARYISKHAIKTWDDWQIV